MPYLKINTNLELDKDKARAMAKVLSSAVATMLAKPENYVMIEVRTGATMLFAGTDAPLAYLELKSLGLPDEQTEDFSEKLCGLIAEHLNIEADRVYIEFAAPARHNWGWNAGTF